MPRTIRLDIVSYDVDSTTRIHLLAYVDKTGWKTPGEASSRQAGFEGSMSVTSLSGDGTAWL